MCLAGSDADNHACLLRIFPLEYPRQSTIRPAHAPRIHRFHNLIDRPRIPRKLFDPRFLGLLLSTLSLNHLHWLSATDSHNRKHTLLRSASRFRRPPTRLPLIRYPPRVLVYFHTTPN